MSKELSVNLKCIFLRNGVEVWIEDGRTENLKKILLAAKESKFIELNNQVINTADITGIFDSETMRDVNRRKSGQWQDDKGGWHDRGERICPRCKQILPFGKVCGKCNY